MVVGPVFENDQVEAHEHQDQQNKSPSEESAQRGPHLIVLEFQLLVIPSLGLNEFSIHEVPGALLIQVFGRRAF